MLIIIYIYSFILEKQEKELILIMKIGKNIHHKIDTFTKTQSCSYCKNKEKGTIHLLTSFIEALLNTMW